MNEENPRLGQVWSCVDSVEVIVGWDTSGKNSMPVHKTLVLIRDDEHFTCEEGEMFDYVKESTLYESERHAISNWQRIA